ncbi:hypothetical protein PVAND_008608 [Polypedilum vanderplanki]|uniref:DH domain-containing protein n=1 Tax=Polypedilum vanderplanki TaxID=319348 RepID=A0A9J6CAH9_POLVA|nr:hypothetical protein PVAND_008608 [Polypedilum vanderplanki]
MSRTTLRKLKHFLSMDNISKFNNRRFENSDESTQSDSSEDENTTSQNQTCRIEAKISPETFKRWRDNALNELINSEESYVEYLGMIVNGYLVEIENQNSEIKKPEELKGDQMKLVFKNIDQIYEWHKNTFFKALQNSLENLCELENVLKLCNQKLHMYVAYCRNKHISEHIVKRHEEYFNKIRQKLNHKLLLSDLLIMPVQRIMKYELLIKDILKHTKRAGLEDEAISLEKCLEIIKIVPKEINNMMILKRMANCEGFIQKTDKIIMHGTLCCIEFNQRYHRARTLQKPKDLKVFLFQQVIIFCDIIGKNSRFIEPTYNYKSHIQVNKLSIEESENFGLKKNLLLKSTDPKRSNVGFFCISPTKEKHQEWFNAINNQLESLNKFCDVLGNPLGFGKNEKRKSC